VASANARSVRERRQVLVVDDAEGIRTYLKNLLSLKGYDVLLADDGRKALDMLEAGVSPEVMVLDIMMPGMDGLEVLERVRKTRPELPVIMLSVVGKASTIVEAMSLGATDYLNKPFEEEELDIALSKVFETESLKADNQQLREKLRQHEAREREDFLWASQKLQRIREVIEQVADADVTVLIHGESGVGKEVIARTLHQLSDRARHAFVKVNCAALPEELLESELFGYERGAFTGASARKAGKFEIANEGTIFLDEIGEMSGPLQAKLLQVLQDGEFSRLGGQADVRVDVRVVAATNRDLEEMVTAGHFREDLYYRLNVVNVHVPPLRERVDEIPVLCDHFLRRYSEKYGRPFRALSDRLMQGFLAYPWPGNVRELENMVKRIVVLQNEDAISGEIFGAKSVPVQNAVVAAERIADEVDPLDENVSLRDIGRRAAREAEREALRRVLYQTNWNRKKAAKILDVSYKTLLQKIKECGLSD
jgi:two-component system response regulator AtoC